MGCQKDPVHFKTVVLDRMKNLIVNILLFTFPNSKAHFYDLWPGADNNCNLHIFPMLIAIIPITIINF